MPPPVSSSPIEPRMRDALIAPPRSRVAETPLEGRAAPARETNVAALFVAASVLGHVVVAYAMPSAPPPAPSAEPLVFMGMFDVPEPEPEPEPAEVEAIEEIEPEPEVAPEPIPQRPRVTEEPEPTPEEPPAEVEETEANPEANPEASEAGPGETTEDAGGTVNSTEGGLAVDRAAGSGRDIGPGGGGRAAPAPAPAPTIDRRALVRAYLRQVQRAIGSPQYTRSLLRAQVEGSVMLTLTVGPSGELMGVRVRRSSGEPLIDDAALAHVRAFRSVPEPPSELDWPRDISLPIRYRLQ